MSSNASRALSKINIPLILLWLASAIIAVLGYLLMTSANSDQAAIYTSGEADYGKLFSAQSASTVGGMLIAVGVLGVLLALAAQTIARRRVTTPEVAVLDTAVLDTAEFDYGEFDNEELDNEELAEVPAAESTTTDAVEPATENVTELEPATAR